ncbi:MAG: SDR family NAD(P)-dependent oxidoreductase [Planctomycetes bacterium]|nr:SDR family NAD(P)-dependent oxidoreductase [Planctomycetota bacterium]
MGLLDGKVAIITGAGGGLGRSHALAMAAQGAKVIVNDVGGARDGVGSSAAAADRVVSEIRAAGGTAAPNYDSVASREGAARIVRAALDAFGRLDCLVNNAGILRDKTLLKMEEEMWDAVIAVHLKGTFLVSQAAAAHFKERAESGSPGGRIVNTTSVAGLLGNFGQSNYAAAKAGIYALTRVHSLELAKFGVTVNAIAPIAKTRMTDDIESVSEEMKPEHVSPMAVFLASDLAADVTGRIFGVHGTKVFEYTMKLSPGVELDRAWTPQEIAERLGEISAAAPVPAANLSAAPAATAGGLPGETIERLFSALPGAVRADKVGDWDSALHFEIAGAENWTIRVSGGKAAVAKGLEGKPTCVVKTDAETLAGMIEGRVKGEHAFMQGKISATNVSDLTKFGKVFDFKKVVAAGAPAAAASPGEAPAEPEASPAERVALLFTALPTAVRAEKAADWEAVVHFEIAGAENFSIHASKGPVRVAKGLEGSPTCVVKTDAETLAGMIEGKVKGEDAFMRGKISATNMADLMKFGKVFDFKKLTERTPAQAGAPAAGGVKRLELLLSKLPEAYLAERADGWSGPIVIAASGGEPCWSVVLSGGACTVAKGATEPAGALVTGDAGTLVEILEGKLDGERAFLDGKVQTTRISAWMQFRRLFDFARLRELADEPPEQKLNRAKIGTVVRAPAVFARPDEIAAYARATNDPNPRYIDERSPGGIVAPPVFPVRLVAGIFEKVFFDPDLGADMARLVHGEEDIVIHRLLRPWDLISPRGSIAGIEDKSSGQILWVEQKLYSAGELAIEMRTGLFIRAKRKDKKEKKEEAPPRPEPVFRARMAVTEDQPWRYADASGDHNPIHVDPPFAKSVGFPNVILQGLCTMAFAGKAVVDEALGGDPTRLARLAVRFAKPVLPGDQLETCGWAEPDKGGRRVWSFETANQKGEKVLVNGIAEAR